MLQLTLAYVIQADQEREVAEDLRNRQWLRTAERPRTAVQPTWPQAANPRRVPTRARGTGV
jgi:hypothetical protein